MQFKWALFYICLLVLFGCSNPKPDHNSQESHNEVLILPDSLDNVQVKSKKVVLKSIKLGGKELEAPIVLPLKSPTVSKLKGNVNVLGQSQERKLGEPLLKKISPKLISNIKPELASLGTPQEIICQTANTSEKAFSNLKFYNQDNGLVSTIVQSMVFDRMGIKTYDVIEAMNTKWNSIFHHTIKLTPYFFKTENTIFAVRRTTLRVVLN